jgi:radical SAM superfamily enzyme YgiQ (UPF0313 family)
MGKGILISYAGYPYTPSSLMPDNGLASLAGILIDAGHEAIIIDYNTLDTMDRLVPLIFTGRLDSLYDTLSIEGNGRLTRMRQAAALLRLHRLEKRLSGWQRSQVDAMADELSDFVSREKPGFIGFKLWNGDGFEGSIAMAERIRRDHPEVRIFGGGPHVYLFRELILERAPVFDALVADEAENAILLLADGSVPFEGIPGLIYRGKTGIESNPLKRPQDLNALPMPVYDESVYPAMKGDGKIRMMIIDESRGCAFTCPFCPQSSRDDNNWRKKSPKRVVDEIERLCAQQGTRLFRFGGQFTPGRLMEDIAREILARKLEIEFTSFAHISAMRGVDFNLLHQAGLRAVFYGVESGSQRMLDGSLEKKTHVGDIEEVIHSTRAAHISVAASMIHPAPGETAETTKETLEFLDRTRPDSVLIYFPGIYPRSGWAANPEKYGITLSEDFVEKSMNYKIKTMYPPRFWEPLPYRVDGRSFAEFTAVTSRFVSEVEKMGIITYITDESLLICRALNMRVEDYSELVKRVFFTADTDRIRALVSSVNSYELGLSAAPPRVVPLPSGS